MLLQSVVLPQMPIGGIALCVVPVCVACVAVREGAERSTLYAILTGVFFCLSGVAEGPIYIVMLSLTAALAGAICDNFYTRSFMPGLVLSLMGLTLCEGSVFLFRVYFGNVSGMFWHTVLLPEILLSTLAFPLFYLSAWGISRIGR